MDAEVPMMVEPHDDGAQRDRSAQPDPSAQPGREPAEFEGGDAACWLQYVCTECGALIEGSTATPCWRCGATRAGAGG